MTVSVAHKNEADNEAIVAVDISLVKGLLDKYSHVKGSLIPILQGIQDIYGYLPAEALSAAARATGLSLSSVYGVATFYAQFRLNPVGKNIVRVCHGTACHVQNVNAVSNALVEELGVPDGGTTEDSLFTLETVACLGCCSLAPVMMIGNETYGNLTTSSAVRIIKAIRRKEKERV
jgi:NADH-quinone oxidoreductase subunit E